MTPTKIRKPRLDKAQPSIDHRSRSVEEIADRTEKRIVTIAAEASTKHSRISKAKAHDESRTKALSLVAQGLHPSARKLPADLGATVVVNPYDASKRTPVLTSLRDDPAGRLYKRNAIDTAQLAAARHWQANYEAAEIGGAKAIDTTKECVDGRTFVDPFGDQQAKAIAFLERCGKWLGQEGDALVRDVLGRRMFLEQAAVARGLNTKPDCADLKYLGKRFRECLTTLAWRLGFNGSGPPARDPSDDYAQLASHAENPALQKAVRRARNPY